MAVDVLQNLLAVTISLFLLRVLERYLQHRNPGSNVAGALEFLIGP